MIKPPKIIFIGTPEFGAIILKKLIQKGYSPTLVISAPDKLIGRKKIMTPPLVKTLALKNGIPVLQPFRIKEIKAEIEKIKPDLAIVAAYGYFIPKEIFDIPKTGTLNVHPSLLPKYRGPSPVQTAILEGEINTGVTIIKIDEEIDHGPIVASEAMKIPPKIYYKELEDQLAQMGADVLLAVIPKWLKGILKVNPQDDTIATFTKVLQKEDGKIDWQKSSAFEVERKIRAFYPWPSSYTFWEENGQIKIIKLIEAEPVKINKSKKPGEVFSEEENKIIIQTKEWCLFVKKLQLAGKSPMTDKEFILGHEGFVGTVLK